MINLQELEAQRQGYLDAAASHEENAKANRWAAQGLEPLIAKAKEPMSAELSGDGAVEPAPEKPKGKRGRPPGSKNK